MSRFAYPTGAIQSPLDRRDYPVAMRLAAAEPKSLFYDGAHDDCTANYRHNHSTAPLVDALTPSEHTLVDAVLAAADTRNTPATPPEPVPAEEERP